MYIYPRYRKFPWDSYGGIKNSYLCIILLIELEIAELSYHVIASPPSFLLFGLNPRVSSLLDHSSLTTVKSQAHIYT
jgi:hypothetical protein